jgi:hypothetical protein
MDAFRTAMSFRFFNWLTNNRIGFCLSQREFGLYLGLKVVSVPLGGIVRVLRARTIPQRFSISVFFFRTYAGTLYIAYCRHEILHTIISFFSDRYYF